MLPGAMLRLTRLRYKNSVEGLYFYLSAIAGGGPESKAEF